MRRFVGMLIAVCAMQRGITHGQEQSAGANADVLGNALWQIAATTKTRIGFEPVDLAWVSGRKPSPLAVSPDEAFRSVVDDRYEWRKVGDIVIVRPKEAWNDAADPFNRPVRSVQVSGANFHETLEAIYDFTFTNRFVPTRRPVHTNPQDHDLPVSFQVQSGTLIDVLNALMVATNQSIWIAQYRHRGNGPDLISLEMRDHQIPTGLVSGHVAIPR